MRSKLLGSAAALALTTCMVVASSAPASAQRWHHWGHGWGWPATAAAGIVGGAIAAATSPLWAPGYYDYYPGYAAAPYGNDYGYNDYGYNDGYRNYYGNYGYGPGPTDTTVVAQNGNSVAYCQSRYRSYDPASGTFLGFDGQRHPCP